MRKTRKSNVMNVYFELKKRVFSLVLFSVNGGIGKEDDKFYREVEQQRRNDPHSVIMSWIKTKISFSVIRSKIICQESSHSIKHEAANTV